MISGTLRHFDAMAFPRRMSQHRLPCCTKHRVRLVESLVRLAGVEPATLGLEDEGRLAAAPRSFCAVPGNRALPLDFSLLASRTEQDSRRTRGLKSACLTG